MDLPPALHARTPRPDQQDREREEQEAGNECKAAVGAQPDQQVQSHEDGRRNRNDGQFRAGAQVKLAPGPPHAEGKQQDEQRDVDAVVGKIQLVGRPEPRLAAPRHPEVLAIAQHRRGQEHPDEAGHLPVRRVGHGVHRIRGGDLQDARQVAGRDDIRHVLRAPQQQEYHRHARRPGASPPPALGRQTPLRQARQSSTVDANTRKSPWNFVPTASARRHDADDRRSDATMDCVAAKPHQCVERDSRHENVVLVRGRVEKQDRTGQHHGHAPASPAARPARPV